LPSRTGVPPLFAARTVWSPKGAGLVPAPMFSENLMGNNLSLQVATLAGGCFWCLEAVYDELKGVESVESGYSGGQVPNPTYREVCNGDTGHAEVVQIKFDPSVISYADLLHVFFTIHDPTTLNRQGNDVGPQYRSAIFYHDAEQKRVAEELIREIDAQKLWDAPIVTSVTPFDKFYIAEAYHQEYFKNNPFQGYCRVVIAPKVAKFRQKFLERLKK
jgi:peptide-methionine (S)-S-oxide reductase